MNININALKVVQYTRLQITRTCYTPRYLSTSTMHIITALPNSVKSVPFRALYKTATEIQLKHILLYIYIYIYYRFLRIRTIPPQLYITYLHFKLYSSYIFAYVRYLLCASAWSQYLPNATTYVLNTITYLPNATTYVLNTMTYLPNATTYVLNTITYLPNATTYLPRTTT